MDIFDYYMGRSFDAYEYLGAHHSQKGMIFRTFAPAASKVSLLYGGQEIPMLPVYDGNFYELQIAQADTGQTYEFRIYNRKETIQTIVIHTAFKWSYDQIINLFFRPFTPIPSMMTPG